MSHYVVQDNSLKTAQDWFFVMILIEASTLWYSVGSLLWADPPFGSTASAFFAGLLVAAAFVPLACELPRLMLVPRVVFWVFAGWHLSEIGGLDREWMVCLAILGGFACILISNLAWREEKHKEEEAMRKKLYDVRVFGLRK